MQFLGFFTKKQNRLKTKFVFDMRHAHAGHSVPNILVVLLVKSIGMGQRLVDWVI